MSTVKAAVTRIAPAWNLPPIPPKTAWKRLNAPGKLRRTRFWIAMPELAEMIGYHLHLERFPKPPVLFELNPGPGLLTRWLLQRNDLMRKLYLVDNVPSFREYHQVCNVTVFHVHVLNLSFLFLQKIEIATNGFAKCLDVGSKKATLYYPCPDLVKDDNITATAWEDGKFCSYISYQNWNMSRTKFRSTCCRYTSASVIRIYDLSQQSNIQSHALFLLWSYSHPSSTCRQNALAEIPNYQMLEPLHLTAQY